MESHAALPEFVRWGTPHLAALAAAVAVALAVLWGGSRLTQEGRYRLCRVLAVIVAAQLIGEYTWRLLSGDRGPWQENLPLHFCSIMAVLSVIALWWRQHWACALVYFGVLTASIQGLITPAVAAGYPSPVFFVFFLSHSLLLIVALAIPTLIGWRGRGVDVIRSVLIMDVYLLCIIPVNCWLGTNYGYTQGSPVSGSILDYLGPPPWYYLWLQLPALAIFRLMLFPVAAKRQKITPQG